MGYTYSKNQKAKGKKKKRTDRVKKKQKHWEVSGHQTLIRAIKSCRRKKPWEEEKWRSSESRTRAVDKSLSPNDAMVSFRKLDSSQFSVNLPSLFSSSPPPANSTAPLPATSKSIYFLLFFLFSYFPNVDILKSRASRSLPINWDSLDDDSWCASSNLIVDQTMWWPGYMFLVFVFFCYFLIMIFIFPIIYTNFILKYCMCFQIVFYAWWYVLIW